MITASNIPALKHYNIPSANFGNGDILICLGKIDEGSPTNLIALFNYEGGEVGKAVPAEKVEIAIKNRPDMFLCFSNSASVRALIDSLMIVEHSLQQHENKTTGKNN